MRTETLVVPENDLETKLQDAVSDGAVEFLAKKNSNGTWTVTTTFED